MVRVNVYYLPGYQPYPQMLAIQHHLHALRATQRVGDMVLVLEHEPVITIGRTPQAESHVLASEEMLAQKGIHLCVTDRGGDVTYHGPGQITVYYIMALEHRDIHHFVHLLEHSVIALLATYGIEAHVDPKYPGVWVGDAKICALGVTVKKWVSFHGIALNICPDLSHFQYIIPCGIQQKTVTSFRQQQTVPECEDDIERVKRAYIAQFARTFQREVHERPLDELNRILRENHLAQIHTDC